MLYMAYQSQADAFHPTRLLARTALATLSVRAAGMGTPAFRRITAAYEMIERSGLSHERPDYEIRSVVSGNETVEVTEVPVHRLPFGTLLNFKKNSTAVQPKVLLVAPLSGHFATLLRGTISTLLQDHDVYVTDWHNARDIPQTEGRFGFDDYVSTLIRFLEFLGPGCHVVAVCQPCVQALAAAAVMAQDNHPCQPRTMTLMAGPVDTRINPTSVNKLATERPIGWFERNMIARVPFQFAGAGRRVYPGFVQLTAFMSMNMQRHVKAHTDLYEHLVKGEMEQALAIKKFYDEYFAVLDMPAEFYLETVQWIFQEARLAQKNLTYQGSAVDCSAIRKTALLTVEGERDDICALGQTAAAHDLCGSLRPHLKRHHMQLGVGHYGVFSGKRWETQIYPIVRNMILANS